MKYQIGDEIVIKLTGEEGKVVEIIHEKMVMIEVKGVRFPAYTDQVDFPYFKRFTEARKAEKKKTYIDQVPREKRKPGSDPSPAADAGVFITCLPVFDKDVFDDDIVEKIKCYLSNRTAQAYRFDYKAFNLEMPFFELSGQLPPNTELYLHDIPFDYFSHNPRLSVEFALQEPSKHKAPYFETQLKFKGKQVFKKIEEIKLANQASFAYNLFESYPDKSVDDNPLPGGVDLSSLKNAGFRMYEASKGKEHLPPPRTVVDLHIDKLTDRWEHLTPFEMLSMQLQAFEKFYDLAIAHNQSTLTIIHGVGSGKLRQELHDLLKVKKEVKHFTSTYTPEFGDGATTIYFR